MTEERYKLLDEGGSALTDEEIQQGWHFCNELDGALSGPAQSKSVPCFCGVGRIDTLDESLVIDLE